MREPHPGCVQPPPVDMLFHKNHISGLCDSNDGNGLHNFLKKSQIRTILFAGINVDFCVMTTMKDACVKGFDTVLLGDAAETINGEEARLAALKTSERGWGFLSTCSDLMSAVEAVRSGNVRED